MIGLVTAGSNWNNDQCSCPIAQYLSGHSRLSPQLTLDQATSASALLCLQHSVTCPDYLFQECVSRLLLLLRPVTRPLHSAHGLVLHYTLDMGSGGLKS